MLFLSTLEYTVQKENATTEDILERLDIPYVVSINYNHWSGLSPDKMWPLSHIQAPNRPGIDF